MKDDQVLIENFEKYITSHCKGLYKRLPEDIRKLVVADGLDSTAQDIAAAKYLAECGERFISRIISGIERSDCVADNAAYLQWFLIKYCYDHKIAFSEGMFNIKFQGDHTQRLFTYLKDDVKSVTAQATVRDFFLGLMHLVTFKLFLRADKATYARMSSHYSDNVTADKHFGIDQDRVPLPAVFKTSVFGLTKDGSMYFKPESSSADIRRKFGSAVVIHSLGLLQSKFYKALGRNKPTLPGTNPNMFREKDIPKKVVELCKELTKDVLNGKKVNWSKKKSLEACRKELVRILRSSLLAKAEKERRFERFSALARQFPLSQVGSEIRIIIQKSVEEGEKIEVVREMASAVESVEPSAEACGLVIISKTDSVSSSPSSDTEESVGPDSPGESPYVTSIVAVSYNPDTRTPTRPDDAQSRTIYHHR